MTFYDTKDAFTAIENGSKLRKPDELPFDLCFGGRRQFCQSNYSDLGGHGFKLEMQQVCTVFSLFMYVFPYLLIPDSSRAYDSLRAKGKFNALDFDTLLKQAQQNLKR